MKLFLLVACFLSVVSAQYFSLRVQDGRAIALGNGGTHAFLKLAPYNSLDPSQHWAPVSAGSAGPGFFIVSRAYPLLNFDISGSVISAGTRLAAWERKSGGASATINQRFNFNATSGFITPASNGNLYVTGTSSGIVQLATKTPTSVGLNVTAAPTAYTIRVIGTDEIVNITFINAPVPNRIIAANVPYVDIVLLAGTTLVAKAANGDVFVPTPYTVTKNDTISLSLPYGSCREVYNPVDGKTWKLSSISTLPFLDENNYSYDVNFCGVPDCASGDLPSISCQDGFRSLGTVGSATFAYAAGKLYINATDGYVDWGCDTPRISFFNLTCRTDNSPDFTGTVSGGCSYFFTIDVPKIYCNA